MEKEFGKETEGSEAIKCLFKGGRKRRQVWRKYRHRQAGPRGRVERERESQRQTKSKSKRGREQHVLWRSFKSLLWGQSFQTSFAQSSCFI